MAKRFLETNIWQKGWWRKLPPKIKLFYIYMICNCDHAGIWADVDLELAEFQIGMPIDKKDILDKLKDHIEVLKEDKWFVKKFPDFQYGVLNPNVKAHASVIKILNKNNLKSYIAVPNSLISVKDKDKDKDKDKSKDKEKDNMRDFEEIIDTKPDPNKIEIRRLKFINDLNKEYHEKYHKDYRVSFVDYWTEMNKSKTKMKFELEKTWDTGRRLSRWVNNSFNKKEDIRSYDSELEFKKSLKLKNQMEEIAKEAADPDEIKDILGIN